MICLQEKHALLMVDIDGFKEVNDTYGHTMGDIVLQQFTGAVHAVLRRGDLLGRLGGGEFFAFLQNIPDRTVADQKAKQICELGVRVPGTDAKITVSIGVAVLPQDGTDFDTLYKKVDAALYQQKKTGKNGYRHVLRDEK